MGLRSAIERRATSASPERYLSEMAIARTSGTPAVVNESQALTHSAVWAGAFLYADLISTLPFAGFRDVDGAPVKLRTEPAIVGDPSVSVSAIDWRAAVVVSLVLRGNAWGMVLTRDQYGFPTTVELEHPDRIRAEWDDSQMRKRVWIDGTEVNSDDVWHCAINLLPGSPFGLSMIGKARQAIYGGVAAAAYGNEFFASGGHPTGLLTSDQPYNADQSQQIKDKWSRLVREGGIAVMGSGMTYQPVQISPEDTQFLDASKASVSDVARFLRLPVELLGGESGSSMTYSNVESRAVDLLRYSIDPVLVRLEAALTRCLPQPQYVKANRAALLRMTTKDRYEAHHMALSDGWRNVNDVRALEDLPPIDGGDEYKTTQAPMPAIPPQVAP